MLFCFVVSAEQRRRRSGGKSPVHLHTRAYLDLTDLQHYLDSVRSHLCQSWTCHLCDVNDAAVYLRS
ncbi:uncharacterized [Lates japonicus]